MDLRIALAASCLAAAGCASSTYIDDYRFLHRHTETIEIVLKSRSRRRPLYSRQSPVLTLRSAVISLTTDDF